LSTFFTDRDLGHQFPELLSRAGIAVEPHDAHFVPDTTDEAWLREIGTRGWYAVTHDSQIRFKPNERDAVMTAGVGLFVLIGHAPLAELAENFIATIRAVERFIERTPAPFIAKVYRPAPSRSQRRRSGTVAIWLSEADWKKSGRRERRRK